MRIFARRGWTFDRAVRLCVLRDRQIGARGRGREWRLDAGGWWFVTGSAEGPVLRARVRPVLMAGDGDAINACSAVSACIAGSLGSAGRYCVAGDGPSDGERILVAGRVGGPPLRRKRCGRGNDGGMVWGWAPGRSQRKTGRGWKRVV